MFLTCEGEAAKPFTEFSWRKFVREERFTLSGIQPRNRKPVRFRGRAFQRGEWFRAYARKAPEPFVLAGSLEDGKPQCQAEKSLNP
jgi:hypothetical protein